MCTAITKFLISPIDRHGKIVINDEFVHSQETYAMLRFERAMPMAEAHFCKSGQSKAAGNRVKVNDFRKVADLISMP